MRVDDARADVLAGRINHHRVGRRGEIAPEGGNLALAHQHIGRVESAGLAAGPNGGVANQHNVSARGCGDAEGTCRIGAG